jgi:hypothetical protein
MYQSIGNSTPEIVNHGGDFGQPLKRSIPVAGVPAFDIETHRYSRPGVNRPLHLRCDSIGCFQWPQAIDGIEKGCIGLVLLTFRDSLLERIKAFVKRR